MHEAIVIDIYSDTICPWCYIGLAKLKAAINESAIKNIKLIWRPFQLNPNMPLLGMERQKYLEEKFGARFNAPAVLCDLAAFGETFYQRFNIKN